MVRDQEIHDHNRQQQTDQVFHASSSESVELGAVARDSSEINSLQHHHRNQIQNQNQDQDDQEDSIRLHEGETATSEQYPGSMINPKTQSTVTFSNNPMSMGVDVEKGEGGNDDNGDRFQGRRSSVTLIDPSEEELERMGKARPEIFSNIFTEAGFIFAIVMSQILTVWQCFLSLISIEDPIEK